MKHSKFTIKLITFLSGFSGFRAYVLIFGFLVSCGLGVPIPEDLTIISAGVLAALRSIQMPIAIGVCIFGVLASDSILFFLGRAFGYRVFRLPVFRSIFTEARIQIARQKVLSNSKFICFTARFLPGLRAAIYLTSGIMGVRPLLFLALDFCAALIMVPIWLYIGWFFGGNLDQSLDFALRMQRYLIVAVIALFALYVWFKVLVARHERKLLEQSEKPPIPSEVDQN